MGTTHQKLWFMWFRYFYREETSLLPDNARLRVFRVAVQKLHIHTLPHPPHFLDLPHPTNIYFNTWKCFLIGEILRHETDIKNTLEKFLRSRSADFYIAGIHTLQLDSILILHLIIYILINSSQFPKPYFCLKFIYYIRHLQQPNILKEKKLKRIFSLITLVLAHFQSYSFL